jgi:hypothetical protein
MVSAIGSSAGPEILRDAQMLATAFAGPGPFAPTALVGKFSAFASYQNVVIVNTVGPPNGLVRASDPFLLAALGVGTAIDELR